MWCDINALIYHRKNYIKNSFNFTALSHERRVLFYSSYLEVKTNLSEQTKNRTRNTENNLFWLHLLPQSNLHGWEKFRKCNNKMTNSSKAEKWYKMLCKTEKNRLQRGVRRLFRNIVLYTFPHPALVLGLFCTLVIYNRIW